VKDNFNFGTRNIPPAESLNGETLPKSLFRGTTKPAYFGNLTWPPFDPENSNPNPSFDSIPSGYRYIHGVNPPGVSTATIVPNPPSGLRLANQ